MLALPKTSDDFTSEWLNAALRTNNHLGSYSVLRCAASDIDIPGQTAEIARLCLTFDDPQCPLPRQMIAKYTSRNPLVTELINNFGQYWRETSFYQEFSDVGLPIPICYYARHDPASQEMVILMSDLAPAMSPAWASTPEHVETAIAHLPMFHGKWWNSPYLLTKDWLIQADNTAFYTAAAGAGAAAAPAIRAVFGHKADASIEGLTLFSEKIEQVMGYIKSRDYTLVHGDYHGKQMFFASLQGGAFAVIDWQFSFVAQGAWDLVRILTLGQSTADRHRNQETLITGYCQGLADLGVVLDRAALDDDMRVGIMISQMIMAIALADTDIALIEKECNDLGVNYQDVLLLRGEAFVQESGAVDFLRRL
jgi:hypothetical protein